MKFEYLVDHQKYVPIVAEWFHLEWSHLNPNRSKEDVINKIHSHFNKQILPIIFIGIDKDELIGTVSLRKFEMENHENLFPWLSSLYVPTNKRKQGIGEYMVDQCLKKSKSLGESKIYLFTENHEHWYKKMGWKTIQQIMHRGYPAHIMQFDL